MENVDIFKVLNEFKTKGDAYRYFNLSGNALAFTPAVTAVPLPAAVWLFGAGLMGVLRLNRRKSV